MHQLKKLNEDFLKKFKKETLAIIEKEIEKKKKKKYRSRLSMTLLFQKLSKKP